MPQQAARLPPARLCGQETGGSVDERRAVSRAHRLLRPALCSASTSKQCAPSSPSTTTRWKAAQRPTVSVSSASGNRMTVVSGSKSGSSRSSALHRRLVRLAGWRCSVTLAGASRAACTAVEREFVQPWWTMWICCVRHGERGKGGRWGGRARKATGGSGGGSGGARLYWQAAENWGRLSCCNQHAVVAVGGLAPAAACASVPSLLLRLKL